MKKRKNPMSCAGGTGMGEDGAGKDGGRRPQTCRQLMFVVLLLGCLSGFAFPAAAEEFLGVEIERMERTHVVTRDVNVRAKPDTKAKRIAGLKKGEKVETVGRHQGWLAILRDGKPLGFTYSKYLVPLVDGSLTQPIRGSATVDQDGKCAFEIVYAGRSAAGIEQFTMADYDVQVHCERNKVSLSFNLFMFLTEGSYRPSKPGIHQIGIDLLEIESNEEYDESFTTNIFYNLDKGKVVFGEVTLKPYAGTPRNAALEVASIGAALAVAVRMALESWNSKAWDELELAQTGNAD